MFDITKVAKEVFGTLRSFNYAVATFDADGNKVYQPEDATRFFTDKRNITVSIHEDGENSSLQVYLGSSVDVDSVLGLLDTLRRTATKFNILFKVSHYHKDIEPKDFAQGNLLEARSLSGTKKSSYLKLEGARMIIRHDKPVDEEKQGARGRNVRKIFIENSDGERMLMPSQNLMAGRAMTRHASKGGTFHDGLGAHLTKLATEQQHMRSCVGYCRENKRKLAEAAAPIIEACKGRGKAIRDIFESVYRRYDKVAPKLSKSAEALVEEVGDDHINLVKKKLQLEDESVIDRPTCESVARVLGESGLLDEAKEVPMIDLPALKCRVEAKAWDDFKAQEPRIEFRKGLAPDISPAKNLPAAALSLIANACVHDAFANMLSQVAQWLEDGKTDVLLKHIAHRAIHCAENAERKDVARPLVKNTSRNKETEIAEMRKELPVVNSVVNEMSAWFDTFDSDRLFEDDEGSRFPRSAEGSDYEAGLNKASSDTVEGFDVTDFLVMQGQDFGYGTDAESNDYKIDGRALKSELKGYIQDKLDDNSDVEIYDRQDIDVSDEVKALLPKVVSKLEEEGYTVENLDTNEDDNVEGDDDQDVEVDDDQPLKFDDRMLDEEQLDEYTFRSKGNATNSPMRGHRSYSGANASITTKEWGGKPKAKGNGEFTGPAKKMVTKGKGGYGSQTTTVEEDMAAQNIRSGQKVRTKDGRTGRLTGEVEGDWSEVEHDDGSKIAHKNHHLTMDESAAIIEMAGKLVRTRSGKVGRLTGDTEGDWSEVEHDDGRKVAYKTATLTNESADEAPAFEYHIGNDYFNVTPLNAAASALVPTNTYEAFTGEEMADFCRAHPNATFDHLTDGEDVMTAQDIIDEYELDDLELDESISQFVDAPANVAKIADFINSRGLEPMIYSGRGMMGQECLGVAADMKGDIADLCAALNMRFPGEQLDGPHMDALGRGVVAYWPHLKVRATGEADDASDGLEDSKQLLLSGEDDELTSEDVLLPQNPSNDLKREVKAQANDDDDDDQYTNNLVRLAGIKNQATRGNPQP